MTAKLNRIKIILAEKDISNRRLAEFLEMGELAISRWVNNRAQPHLETLFKIADVLKVDVRELLEGNTKIERPDESEFSAPILSPKTDSTAAKTVGEAGAEFLKKMQAVGAAENDLPSHVYVLFEMMDLAAGTVALAGVWADLERLRAEMISELGEKSPAVAALQRTLDASGQTNFVGPSGSIFLLFKARVR